MSKTIDERVVSMKFNNENFEKNVAQSMSTLDKLKEKLSFKGASKGIDELNGSMKKFDVHPISSALDFVGGKFNYVEQMAIGAFRKIGDQIVSTAEQTIKSMSGLENMAAGWSKYGNKTTAVTTLVAQGFDLDVVNDQMEKLNWYTDETSYNFVDMVSNIGKFTASGQGLEDAVNAMMGIANWAALSGQNATKASMAMYQLSQAMSKGALRYDDWKSIQNASMDTKEFREMAAGAAEELGMLKKVGEDAYAFVYEAADGTKEISENIVSLNDLFTSDQLTRAQWLDTDVMMKVFNTYGKASKALKTLIDNEWEGVDTASAAMEELENKARALADEMIASGQDITEDEAFNQALRKVTLEAIGDIDSVKQEVEAYRTEIKNTTGEEISFDDALVHLGYDIDAFALKALRAAQQARTWEDVIDSVKDAVSTGWMNVFEKIIGDQEEAVDLMTRFANDFWDIFAAPVSEKNDVLAVWRNWIDPVERYKQAVSGIPSQYQKVVAEMNGVSGRDKLFSTEEGNLGAVISLLQTLKQFLGIIKDSWNEVFYGTTNEETILNKKADALMAITDAIKAFADFLVISEEKAEKLRRTFKGLFAVVDILGMFVKSILSGVFKALGSAFENINLDIFDMTASLGDNLVALRDWLKANDIFGKVFESIGEGIGNFVGWIKDLISYVQSIPWVSDVISKLQTGFAGAAVVIGDFFSRIFNGEKAIDVFTDIINKLKETSGVVSWLVDAFTNVKEFFSGLFSGIGDFFKTAFSNLPEGKFEFGDIFKGIGEAFENAKTGVDGFWNSLKPAFDNIKLYFDGFVFAIRKTLGGLSAENIAQLIGAGILFAFIIKLVNVFKAVTDFFKSFAEIGENISSAVKKISTSFSKATDRIGKAISRNINARSFKIIAESILLIVAAVTALYFMAMNSEKNNALGTASGTLITLIGFLIAMVSVLGKVNTVYRASFVIGAIALSLIALVVALKMIADTPKVVDAAIVVGILSAVIAIISLVAVFVTKKMGDIGRAGLAKKFRTLAELILSMSGSILILAIATKLLGDIDSTSLFNAVTAIGILSGIVVALAFVSQLITKQEKDIKGIGRLMLGISASFLIVAAAIKVFSLLSPETFENGILRVAMVEALFIALIAVSALAGENGSKAGSMILKMSIAFIAMVGVIALIDLLDDDAIKRGMGVIVAFGIFCSLLIVVSKLAGKDAAEAGKMLLAISGAILILTGVIWALSFLSLGDLAKSVAAISILMIIFGGLIAITRYAAKTKNLKGTLIVLSVAIGILAASVGALALIGNNGDIIKAAAAMAIVLGVFALVISATKFAQKSLSTIIVLTVAIVAIGAMLAVLVSYSGDTDAAINCAGAMAILLGTMAGVLFVLSKIKVDNWGSVFALIGAMGVLAIVIGLMSGIFESMKEIDPNSCIQHATAMIMLLAVMTGVVAAFAALGGGLGKGGMNTGIGAVAGLAAGMLALWALSGIMLILNDVIIEMKEIDADSATKYAIAISALLVTMTGVIAILGVLGGVGGAASATGVGAVVAIGGIVGILLGEVALLALAGVLLTLNDVIIEMKGIDGDAAIKYATSLSELLLAMAGSLVILAGVGALVIPALVGIAMLAVMADAMLFLTTKIGELVTTTPEIKQFIDEGIPLLNQLATGIGSFFGSIIAGFIDAVAKGVFDILPIFGASLTNFAMNALGFIVIMSSIPTETLAGVETLAKAILLLTAAEFINGVSSFFGIFTGKGNGMETFGSGLKTIGEGVANFSNAVNGNIYPDEVTLAVTALEQLVGLSGSVDTLRTIVGTAGLDALSSNLGYIGSGIAAFSTAVNGKIYPQPMTQAVTQLGSLVRIGDNLNFLGLLGGTLALGAFSSNLGYIGSGIAAFSVAVNGKGSAMYTEVAITALGRLVTIGQNLDVISSISSAAGLNLFAGNLENIADGVVKFSKKVEGQVKRYDIETAISVMERLSAIRLGFGFIDQIANLKSLELFASNLPYIGESIKTFSDKVDGIEADAASSAISILSDMSALGTDLTGGNVFGFISMITGLSGLDAFASNLPFIGDGIAKFVTKIGGSLAQSTVSTSVNAALGVLRTLAELQTEASGGVTPWDVIDTISGITDLTKFSQKLPEIAVGIGGFILELKRAGAVGEGKTELVTDAIGALSGMNDLISNLENSDKLDKCIEKLNSYATSIGELGSALSSLITSAEDYDVEKLKNVSASLDELNAIAEKQNALNQKSMTDASKYINFDFSQYQNTGSIPSYVPTENISMPDYSTFMGANGWDESSIEEYMGSLGVTGGTSFASGMFNEDSIGNWEDTLNSIGLDKAFSLDGNIGGLFKDAGSNGATSLLTGMFGGDESGAGGTDMLSGLVSGFEGINIPSLFGETGDIGALFSQGGDNAVSALLGAMTGDQSKSDAEAAGKQLGTDVVTGYKQRYSDLAQAGKFSVEGLLNAIKDMAPEAQAAGEEIAKSLTSGIELSLKIASPSKVMYGLGEYAGEGFVNALFDYVSISGSAGEDLGITAADSMREALEQGAKAFDTSVDVEPTIRPVLDLTDINEGIGELDGMFDGNRSVALAGTVNAAMNGGNTTIQNEVKVDNSDIIQELNGLRTDMGVMADKLSKLQVVLDTNVLVGELVDPMDSALGRRTMQRRRG